MTKLFTASVAAVAAVLSLASAAAAQETIRYGDLDLTTQAGVTRFENRVAFAASRACASEAAPGVGRLNVNACERDFRNQAMRVMPQAARDQIVATRDVNYLVSAR